MLYLKASISPAAAIHGPAPPPVPGLRPPVPRAMVWLDRNKPRTGTFEPRWSEGIAVLRVVSSRLAP